MIQYEVEIMYKDGDCYMIEFEYEHRLHLNDSLYIWHFLSADDVIPSWLEDGSVAIIEEVCIYRDRIYCLATYKMND